MRRIYDQRDQGSSREDDDDSHRRYDYQRDGKQQQQLQQQRRQDAFYSNPEDVDLYSGSDRERDSPARQKPSRATSHDSLSSESYDDGDQDDFTSPLPFGNEEEREERREDRGHSSARAASRSQRIPGSLSPSPPLPRPASRSSLDRIRQQQQQQREAAEDRHHHHHHHHLLHHREDTELMPSTAMESHSLPVGSFGQHTRLGTKRSRRTQHMKASDARMLRLRHELFRESRRRTIPSTSSLSSSSSYHLHHHHRAATAAVEVDSLELYPLLNRLAAYCVSESLDLVRVSKFFRDQMMAEIGWYSDEDVLHIVQARGAREAFVFAYGAMVFWNYDKADEVGLLMLLSQFGDDPVPADQRQEEVLDYRLGEKASVANDEVVLESKNTEEKLSVSFALAQCVKLSWFEERIQKNIDKSRGLPEGLARTGSITVPQEEVARQIGVLFQERSRVNLNFDLLDTPDWLWSNEEYRPIYERLHKYLELDKRVEILNKRLDIMEELYEMLLVMTQHAYSAKVEWIIIALIAVEIAISLIYEIFLKDVLHWFPRPL